MQPIIFCDRCRGLEVGWNRKYLTHRAVCVGGPSLDLRLVAYTVTVAFLISFFPSTTSIGVPGRTETATVTARDTGEEVATVSDPAVYAIEDVWGRHSRVDTVQRACIARVVVASAPKV